MIREVPRHERDGAGGTMSSGFRNRYRNRDRHFRQFDCDSDPDFDFDGFTLYPAEFRIIRISPSN